MSKKVLHVKFDKYMPHDEVKRIAENLNKGFKGTDYKVLYGKENVDIEVFDPDVMKDIRKDLQELKEFLMNPLYVIDAKDIDYDEPETFESGGDILTPPPDLDVQMVPYGCPLQETDKISMSATAGNEGEIDGT